MSDENNPNVLTTGHQGDNPDTKSGQSTGKLVIDVPLASVVVSPRFATFTSADVYRRYCGVLTSTTTLCGRLDVNTNRTVFQVGARSWDDPYSLLVPPGALVNTYAQTFMLRSELSTEIDGIMNKYSNFTTRFQYMDLSALAYQLAAGVAVYAQTGSLTGEQLAGGMPLRIQSLATAFDPVSAPAGGLFIPRAVDHLCKGVFAALVCAANAYDVEPYTDLLEVNASNIAKLVLPSDGNLAVACVQGLRYLLAQADECGAGSIIAFAITCGIHQVATVVAHSDEGGYMRDVFRYGSFCAPYGAIISTSVRGFMGLPVPSANSISTFVAFVDNIALATAGLTAVCDPLITYDGKQFPTVSTYQSGPFCVAGENTTLNSTSLESAAQHHARFIAATCGDYCDTYIRELGQLFMVKGGESIASICYAAKFNTLPPVIGRHLRHVTVAPYYWIEPTGMFKTMPVTDAVTAGYATIGPVGSPVTRKNFENIILQNGGSRSTIAVSFRSLRTNPLLVHLAGHSLDGLANFIPIQFLQDRICNVGGTGNVVTKRTAARGLDAYMWGKQQTCVPHPAEVIYTGSSVGMQVIHDTYDRSLVLTRNHVPTADELVYGEVTFHVGRISGVPPGPLGPTNNTRRRERSRAVEALMSTARDVARTVNTGGETVAVGDFEPLTVFPTAATITDNSAPTSTPAVAVGTYVVSQAGTLSHTFVSGMSVPRAPTGGASRGTRQPGGNVQTQPQQPTTVVTSNVASQGQTGSGGGQQLATQVQQGQTAAQLTTVVQTQSQSGSSGSSTTPVPTAP